MNRAAIYEVDLEENSVAVYAADILVSISIRLASPFERG
jgi:hypothetical protein